jgi:NADPH-dependent 2,4-dienoyl-CoA reductase/sulfur reductase-like enzyme
MVSFRTGLLHGLSDRRTGHCRTADAAMVCDVAIVGPGPYGLAAAVYASFEGALTIVIESTVRRIAGTNGDFMDIGADRTLSFQEIFSESSVARLATS